MQPPQIGAPNWDACAALDRSCLVLGTWHLALLCYSFLPPIQGESVFQSKRLGESVNKRTWALCCLFSMMLLLGATAWAGETLWTYKSGSDLKWHRLLQTGE